MVEASALKSGTAPTGPSVSAPTPAMPSPDDLIARNRHLCRRGARKFWRAGLERSDLEQVAALGLIKAARRYDGLAGVPFEAYAWQTIVGELMHHVRDHEHAVRVPRRLRTLEPRFKRAYESCTGRFGHDPSDADLAHEMGIEPALVRELHHARRGTLPVPLDDPRASALRSDAGLATEDRVLVNVAFSQLSRLERRVVIGIDVLGLTRIELGRTLRISPRSVAVVRREALARMQRTWSL